MEPLDKNNTNQPYQQKYRLIFPNNNGEYVYVMELPPNAIEIFNHNDFLFRDYYIDEDAIVYHFNGIKYKKLKLDIQYRVKMVDICNRKHMFSINSLINAFLYKTP